jgi:hypothetical protein
MITFRTTKEQFVQIQIDEFRAKYPKQRLTAKIKHYFEDGNTVDGDLFAWIVRDTYEQYKYSMLRGEVIPKLKDLFVQFTKDYAECPEENKFSLYVGFLYFLETREDNLYNGSKLLENDTFFVEANELLKRFNRNDKEEYSPFVMYN